jgi:flagellar protein FliO/FliZ
MLNFPAFLRSVGAAVLGCLLIAPAAFAADGESTPLNLPAQQPAKVTHAAGPGSGNIVRTIVGLAIVLGVIYGLHWVLKQVKASKASGATGAGLHSIASLPLGTGGTLHLIRAGNEFVLLGTGERGVTPIRTYSAAEARSLGLIDDLVTGTAVVAAPTGLGGPSGGIVAKIRARTVVK